MSDNAMVVIVVAIFFIYLALFEFFQWKNKK